MYHKWNHTREYIYRKADSMFTDYDEWQAVNDRDRRELFDDVIHMLEKREKVQSHNILFNFFQSRIEMFKYCGYISS